MKDHYVPSSKGELVENLHRFYPAFVLSKLKHMKKKQLYAIYYSFLNQKKG